MSPDRSQAAERARPASDEVERDQAESEETSRRESEVEPAGATAEAESAAKRPVSDLPVDERIVALHASLLESPQAPSERRPERRWAYPLWGVLVVSLFVAYHVAVLLVWNTPSKGLNKEFHKQTLETIKGNVYFNGTRNNQSWAMFAPNPNRSNTFIRVIVEDQNGEFWDFGQDIWGNDRYPYVFYDRRGKINRRIDGKKHYQRLYGAWVCREWERQHGGEPAKSVSFIKRYTRIPPAHEVIERGGWEPWGDHYKQKEQETITCKTTPDAQLTNELRERYGLPPVDEKTIRRTVMRTWYDQKEAERKKVEREQKAAEARERWKTKNEEGGSEEPEWQGGAIDAREAAREDDGLLRDEGDEITREED